MKHRFTAWQIFVIVWAALFILLVLIGAVLKGPDLLRTTFSDPNAAAHSAASIAAPLRA
ncbi:hypothetical protein M3A96_03425 [Helcobacillus massiliensis]|uniref:hypothetical protein n=1 Tax=Helcobacillus TaxID=1161125 RepID=UPI001EF5151D|nr:MULTISPECIES: hypothetical protein [Helcobacillus]MCG7426593.1 hypothetical protein [Helcobacillus sp. ACRRO]MCT1557175.1 hypothetical protein [Helcobacillus massiliensis]MCT2036090.1 hypothetical protein [Helcobacillus massiliensis]MCT2331221.1 hypothetical protein [Helcobacillus massiliensis]